MRKLGEFFRSSWFLVAAVIIMLTPVLFDIAPIGEFWRPLDNTRDAIYGLIGVLVTANLINLWSKRRADKRDEARFAGISVVAYRSLAQAANDAGRMLLAPVIGADLHAAAIPGFTPDDHERDLFNLEAIGVTTDFLPKTGEWDRDFNLATLEPNLLKLIELPEFVPEMFRRTSRARRLLQESMATWAPVVLTVPRANELLAGGWKFSNQTVLLLESWRKLMVARIENRPSEELVPIVVGDYVQTIRQYQSWIAEIRPLLQLPTRARLADEVPENA